MSPLHEIACILCRLYYTVSSAYDDIFQVLARWVGGHQLRSFPSSRMFSLVSFPVPLAWKYRFLEFCTLYISFSYSWYRRLWFLVLLQFLLRLFYNLQNFSMKFLVISDNIKSRGPLFSIRIPYSWSMFRKNILKLFIGGSALSFSIDLKFIVRFSNTLPRLLYATLAMPICIFISFRSFPSFIDAPRYLNSFRINVYKKNNCTKLTTHLWKGYTYNTVSFFFFENFKFCVWFLYL